MKMSTQTLIQALTPGDTKFSTCRVGLCSHVYRYLPGVLSTMCYMPIAVSTIASVARTVVVAHLFQGTSMY